MRQSTCLLQLQTLQTRLFVRWDWSSNRVATRPYLVNQAMVKKNKYLHLVLYMGRFCMTVKWSNPGLCYLDFGR